MAKIVIVIGDDPTLYRVTAWALEEDGHTVDVVEVANACERVKKDDPEVIVINTNLAKGSRQILVWRLLQAAPASQVIDLVTNESDKLQTADAMVRKPYTPDELSQAVSSLLSQE